MATLKDGGGDYADLEAAIIANETTIDISGTWDNDDPADATLNIDAGATTITATGSSHVIERPFNSGDTQYRLRAVGDYHLFTLTNDIILVGIDAGGEGTAGSEEIFRVGSSGADVTCTRCHLGFSGIITEQDIVYVTGTTSGTFIFNSSTFYDVGRSIIDSNSVTGTLTVKFNSCSGFNIGVDGGRLDGSWIGSDNSNTTVNADVFNCLIQGDIGEAAFRINDFSAGVLNIDNSITNYADAESAVGDIAFGGWDTINRSNGNTYGATFTHGDPASGAVGLTDITTTPYDLSLFDDATDNVAQENHTTATGTDSGLAMPDTDVTNASRSSAGSPTQGTKYDVGSYEVPAGGATHEEAVVDGLALGDTPINIMTRLGAVTDSIVLNDTPINTMIRLGVTTDSIDLGDSVINTLTRVGAASDGVGFGDSNTNLVIYLSAVTDGVVFNDSIATALVGVVSIADSVVFNDLPNGGFLFTVSLADGVDFGDTIVATLTRVGTLTDSVDLGDSVSTIATLVAAVLDSVDLGDSVVLSGNIFNISVADGITLGDLVSQTGALITGMTVTFTLKQATIAFTLKQPTASFTLKQPTATFTKET